MVKCLLGAAPFILPFLARVLPNAKTVFRATLRGKVPGSLPCARTQIGRLPTDAGRLLRCMSLELCRFLDVPVAPTNVRFQG